MKNMKFVFVLLFHLFSFALCLALLMQFSPTPLVERDFFICAFFSTLYLYLNWLRVYTQPIHQYLKNASIMIVQNLLICSLAVFVVEVVFVLLSESLDAVTALIQVCSLFLIYGMIHVALYSWIFHLSRLGFFTKRVILIGNFDDRLPVEQLLQNVNDTKLYIGQLLYRNDVWMFYENCSDRSMPVNEPISGFLLSRRVNELILCMGHGAPAADIAHIAEFARTIGLDYYLIPDISDLPKKDFWVPPAFSLPIIERFATARDSLICISIKRLLDILISFGAIVALMPLFVIIGIAIKLEDGGKVFYVSNRIGIHGKVIRFFKFRSMVPNAESMKDDLRKLNERPDGPLFKLTNDPRITKIGRVLRTSSLDELPQLFNVLRGDMSLIGPRPHLPEEVVSYSPLDALRLDCIPGISCLPQIRGRNTLGFREWVDLDLEYRMKWSLEYDVKIFFGTIMVVLSPLFKKRS